MPGNRLIHVCILVSFVILAGCEDYQYCPPGMSWCWARCVDLVSDVNNCGACGYKCPPGVSCVDGDCVYEGCTSNDDCPEDECCMDFMCVRKDCRDIQCGPDPVCNISCGDCGGWACVDGRCVEGCTTRDDCAGPVCLVCKDYACVPPPPVCQGDHDCCVGYWCNFGICEGGGRECMSDDECRAFDPEKPRCVDGRCWPECFADIDCPLPGMTCIDNHCVGAEPGHLGDPCAYDAVNAVAGDCDEGFVCLGIPADGNAGTCPNGSPEECTQIREEWNPDCVTGNCGASFCMDDDYLCDEHGNCPPGYIPVNANSFCFCLHGDFFVGEPGDPCPWGNVNSEYGDCEAGLSCLGNPDAGSCPGGSVSECTEISESYNPDCVNGTCGFSFCSDECDAQGDCPQGFDPVDLSGECYCIPAEPGDSQAGDPCPFGDVNGTHDYCAAGLVCLGVAADGPGGTCPGGSPNECTDIPASQNPDCVNGNCGASFCAEECPVNGTCQSGFEPQDVSGTCYCIPVQ